jgi:hypothetical protein
VPESSADRNSELTLILMASSADPDVFKELMRGKKYLAQVGVFVFCATFLFIYFSMFCNFWGAYLNKKTCNFIFKLSSYPCFADADAVGAGEQTVHDCPAEQMFR